MKTSYVNRISRDPSVDWIFMLCISILAVMVFVAIGVFSYIDVGAAISDKPNIDILSAKR